MTHLPYYPLARTRTQPHQHLDGWLGSCFPAVTQQQGRWRTNSRCIPAHFRHRFCLHMEARFFFSCHIKKIAACTSHWELSRWLRSKASACNAGDTGSIPGPGKPPGGGQDNPHQYSCLENLMDRRTWWTTDHRVAESDTTEVTEHTCTISSVILSIK